jgi:hypothetical protein
MNKITKSLQTLFCLQFFLTTGAVIQIAFKVKDFRYSLVIIVSFVVYAKTMIDLSVGE